MKSTMRTYSYTSADAQAGLDPFRGEFSTDPWVAYHGTSSHAEASIDANGLAWSAGTHSREEIGSVVELFERLQWAGIRGGGFGVLASFTQHDFARSAIRGEKPIFLAESGYRSLLYASKEWAGGESARALRFALEDLDRYLLDSAFRETQVQESWNRLRNFYQGEVPTDCEPAGGKKPSFPELRNLWNYYDGLMNMRIGVGGSAGIEPVQFSESWLAEALGKLQPLRDRCRSLVANFSHGVVYAVRFRESDVPSLTYDQGGLVAQLALPPSRILAKATVAIDVGYPDSVFLAANKGKCDALNAREGVFVAARKKGVHPLKPK